MAGLHRNNFAAAGLRLHYWPSIGHGIYRLGWGYRVYGTGGHGRAGHHPGDNAGAARLRYSVIMVHYNNIMRSPACRHHLAITAASLRAWAGRHSGPDLQALLYFALLLASFPGSRPRVRYCPLRIPISVRRHASLWIMVTG